MRLYPCAASARNSASVMMLQRFSLQLQRYCGASLSSARRDGGRSRLAPPAPFVAVPGAAVANTSVEVHRSGESNPFGKFVQRGNYTITIQALHRPPLVVAVRHAENRATCRTRGLRIVGGIAEQQQPIDRYTKVARCMPQWRRIGLPGGKRVAADDETEVRCEPGLVEMRPGEAARLVGHAGKSEPCRREALEAFAHARKNGRLASEHAFVCILVHRERALLVG